MTLRLCDDWSRKMMTGSETIGIMADSHGDAEAIAGAIRFFREFGCGRLVHLGDICDSVACDSSDRCVGQLRDHNVLAVKGNNDHAVVKNSELVKNGVISRTTAAYLTALPLQMEISAALFVHSRPFADRLGLAAMTGEVGETESDWLLKKYPGKILFRGHGHSPGVSRFSSAGNLVKNPAPEKRMLLDSKQNWVVTCGALYKGLCMTWAIGESIVTSHRLAA